MGQTVRGGRSCPSEMKLGGGDERSGNLMAVKSSGSSNAGTLLTSGASEQYAEHMLHLSGAAWSLP